MDQPTWVPLVEAQYHAGKDMAGTFLFRTFGFAKTKVAPGTPVLSDIANEHGPLLIQTLGTALAQLDIRIGPEGGNAKVADEHQPQLTFLDTQKTLEPRLSQIAGAYKLEGGPAAHASAIGAALLIHRAKSALDPATGFGIAVYGFVEGLKTMPIALPGATPQSKPWYKLW